MTSNLTYTIGQTYENPPTFTGEGTIQIIPANNGNTTLTRSDITTMFQRIFPGIVPNGGNSNVINKYPPIKIEIDARFTILAEKCFYESPLSELSFQTDSQLITLGNFSFAQCHWLQNVDLSTSSITGVGVSAFSQAGRNLPTDVYFAVIFPSSLRTFGKGAFSGAKLQWIHIPEGDSSPYFYSGVFKGCMHLESVSLPSFKTNHTYNDMDSPDWGLFLNTPKLKTGTCHKDTVRAFTTFTQNLFVYSETLDNPDPVGYIAKPTIDAPLVRISASQATGTTVLFPFTNGDTGPIGLDAHKKVFQNTFGHVVQSFLPGQSDSGGTPPSNDDGTPPSNGDGTTPSNGDGATPTEYIQ
jgi:hypothetical protein